MSLNSAVFVAVHRRHPRKNLTGGLVPPRHVRQAKFHRPEDRHGGD
jgi:hypothetical protein